MADKDDVLETLQLPEMSPLGLARHFGPGLILMMTGIGTSHLVTAPVGGGRFEFALLWAIPVAYIFKYYGFEMAFRFTNATGRSMLDAYSTAAWKWPLWYVLVTTLVQAAIGQAGRLTAAAAVSYYFVLHYFGVDVPAYWFAMFIGVFSVVIILSGRYHMVELVTKICAGILLVSTVGVYLREPAPLSGMAHFFMFEVPQGSWLILAAFLGLLPTGIDVSLQASEWGKAKKAGMGKIRDHLESIGLAPKFSAWGSTKEDLSVDTSKLSPHALEYCRRWFRIGLWDFRFGHVISFIIAVIFLALAAVWIYPSEVEGRAVIGQIAEIFTESVGPGMMIVFLLGALAATFSTAFNYFDGWPRVVAACCRNLFRGTAKLSGTAREDLTDEHRKDVVLRVQHLPHDDVLFADRFRRDHRGRPPPGMARAGRIGTRLFRSAGDLRAQPLLLLHRDPKRRYPLLPEAVRRLVRVGKPRGVHGPDGDPDRGEGVRNPTLRRIATSPPSMKGGVK